MKLDFNDLPIGEHGLSTTLIDKIWETLGASLERTGVEEFRRGQRGIVGRVSHNTAGVVLTEYNKEVAVVLPLEYSKVAVALVHLAENARVNAAMDEVDADPNQTYVSRDELISAEDDDPKTLAY